MKYLLPPAWSLSYQRLARYGLIIIFILISFGRPLLMAWFTPGFALISTLQRMVAPYIIPSQWTM
jgi:hypothetical protein